jgi:hypothetical protein
MSFLYEFLKNNKVGLASVPVINYVIFIIYSMVKSIPRGIIDLGMSTLFLPLTIIGMILLFLFLKLFGNQSSVPVYALTMFALISIIHTVYKMIMFKPIKIADFKKKISNISSKVVDLATGKFNKVLNSVTSSISSSASNLTSSFTKSEEITETPVVPTVEQTTTTIVPTVEQTSSTTATTATTATTTT